tara:strand:- start:3299 stop:5536 length:2238 start_codon:yes stop_codon:yes gene_type:complete
MATAKLTAVVTTKGVQKSERELKKFTEGANKAEKQTKNTGKSVASMEAPFLSAVSFVGKAAAAATAFVAAGVAIVVTSSKANRELGILAKQARTTSADFQALAFASEQYGITGEQIADISKDIADKVGEFATAGTGAFQDYADVMGITKDEAVKVAKEFQGLSSQEVIGKMVAGLESVNASGDQTTFVLESIGNDLSRLSPLFANNSSELKTLKDRYKDVNSQLALTAGQSKALDEVAASGTLLAGSLGNAGKLISSAVAPILDDFFNDVIAAVPKATQAVVDFINVFKDVENINSIKSITSQTNDAIVEVAQLRDVYMQVERNIKALQSQGIVGESIISQEVRRLDEIQSQMDAQNATIDKLQERKKKLETDNKVSAPTSIPGVNIGGVTGGISTGDKREEVRKEIDAIVSLNETALQRIDSKEDALRAKAVDALAKGFINKKEALDAEIAAEVNAESQRMEIRKREEDQLLRNKELAQEKLSEFIALNNTELEEVTRVEQERLDIIQGYRDGSLEREEEYNAARVEIEQSASDKRKDIAEEEAKKKADIDERTRRTRRSIAEGVLSDLETIGGRETKAFKAAAKINAIVKTYEAANSAFASLAPIPIVGPALGAAAAGVAVAAGLANVRAIDSAREQGGQLSAGQSSTIAERGQLEVIAPVNASRVRTANQMKSIMGEGSSKPEVNVVIIDQSEGKKEFDQSTDDEGRIILLIRSTTQADAANPNSGFRKSLSSSTNVQARRN